MNSKLCILLVIALCLTQCTLEASTVLNRKKGPCHMRYKDNQCCKQSDCPSQSTCCKLPCGNVCLRESPVKTNGVPVKDGEPCEPSYYN
uniref:U18-Sparatoxin-Hju1a_1 n=1 Tax=Heteropoda jugulans TaxID=1358901 RepID=A0A4Q8KDK4_9ARAC